VAVIIWLAHDVVMNGAGYVWYNGVVIVKQIIGSVQDELICVVEKGGKLMLGFR